MRQSPKYPELTVHKDGRIFDTNQSKWLNVNRTHSSSFKGPVAFWTTNGRTHTLSIIKMLYETYVSEQELKREYTIEFKNGDENDIRVENLKKVKKYEKEVKEMRNFSHDSWMGGNDIYIL